MSRGDAGVVAAGMGMLITSFLPWWEASAFGYTESRTAWDVEFLGARLAVILAVAAAGYVVARAKGLDVNPLRTDPAVLVLLLAFGALVSVLIQLATDQDVHSTGVIEAGWQVGVYLGLLLTLAQTACAGLALLAARRSTPDPPGMSP
jgi:hypothetical protein